MTTPIRIAVVAAAAIAATVAIAQVRNERSPAQPGERQDGTAFRTPSLPAQQVRRPEPLRVDSFVVHRIGQGSALGAAGDLLITFAGRGFMLTARAPRVLVGDDLVLDATEINAGGTELYVLVPASLTTRIQSMRFDSVIVANPGGLQDTEHARAAVAATPDRLLRPERDAPTVRLVYDDGSFRRELAR